MNPRAESSPALLFRACLIGAILTFGLSPTAGRVQPDPEPLLEAARAGDAAAVARLLAEAPELVKAGDHRSCTALHFAVNEGHNEVIELLLTRGADLEARDVDGDTPLHWAACTEHLDTIDLLVRRGAVIDARSHTQTTPVLMAASRLLYPTVERLVDHGADLELANDYGRTPLLWVTREGGDIKMAKLLLRRGADVNALDRFGDSPLTLAAWRGFNTLVGIFLDAGARVDVTPEMGRDLLNHAVAKGLDRLYKAVTAKGIPVDIAPGRWTSLLHTAAVGGSSDIVDDLLRRGAPATAVDMYGWTPLHHASARGHTDICRVLLDTGARPDLASKSGLTPLYLATRRGAVDLAALLRKAGAKSAERRFFELKGPFLGQGNPPATPQPFAPDLVANCIGEHGSASFTPDGKQAFWSGYPDMPDSGYYRGTILTSRLVDGRWTEPYVPAFVDEHRGDVPCVAPDGRRLFFMSIRPLEPGGSPSKENIWVVERDGDGWGEPVPLPPCINQMRQHWQFGVAANGNLYFGSRTGGDETRGVYLSRFIDGQYTTPEFLGIPGSCPFVAPDESYLITFEFDQNVRTLAVRFRQPDGGWGRPLAVSDHYPEISGICPQVSPDGKAFFFISQQTGANNNFWVSADFLGKLKERWDGS